MFNWTAALIVGKENSIIIVHLSSWQSSSMLLFWNCIFLHWQWHGLIKLGKTLYDTWAFHINICIYVAEGCFCYRLSYLLTVTVLFCPSLLTFSYCRLRSSLWLQFKPHHIAAGAAFLAARFLNFDLSYYQNIWHEFKTTPSILQGTQVSRVLGLYGEPL